MPALEALGLGRLPVDDGVFPLLAKCGNLSRVSLFEAKGIEQALADFEAAHPEVVIDHAFARSDRPIAFKLLATGSPVASLGLVTAPFQVDRRVWTSITDLEQGPVHSIDSIGFGPGALDENLFQTLGQLRKRSLVEVTFSPEFQWSPRVAEFLSQQRGLNTLTLPLEVPPEQAAALSELANLYELELHAAANELFAHWRLPATLGVLSIRSGDDASLSDEGLKHLAHLTHLKQLDLIGYRQITGPGLSHFAGSKRLARLNLHGCGITDEAVPHLLKLKSVRVLDLTDTHLRGETLFAN